MLVLTETATSVIRSLGDREELPEDSGLRIAGPADEPTELTISWAVTPRQEDQVIDLQDARVFLDPTADDLLDNMILDAKVEDDGQVRFVLADQ